MALLDVPGIHKMLSGLTENRRQAIESASERGAIDIEDTRFWQLIRAGHFGAAATYLLDRGCEIEADMLWAG